MIPVRRGVAVQPAATPPRPGHDPRIDELTGIAKLLARRAGYDAGLQLIMLFGGARIFIPRTIRTNCPLHKLGPKAAAALSELRGGEQVDVPTGRGIIRKQIIAYLSTAGTQKESKRAVAKKFGVHARTVQRIRAELRRRAGQAQKLRRAG